MEHYKSRNNDYYHFTNPQDDRSQFDDSDEIQYNYYDIDDDCTSPSAYSKISDVSVTVGGFYKPAFIFQLDSSMKNVTDKLLHEMETIETRISRLDDETGRLDKYVANVKDSDERYHGTTYGKLTRMQSVLQEVQDGVLLLRDKHEIAETQLQLAKLQVSMRDPKYAVQTNRPQSSLRIPFTALLNQVPSNVITFSQDISFRQAPEVIAQQHVIPLNQQMPHRYKADPQIPLFTQLRQFNSFQETPNKPSYSCSSSEQHIPPEPTRWGSAQEHQLLQSSRNYKSEFHAKYMPEFDNFKPYGKPLSSYENSNFKPVEYSLRPRDDNSRLHIPESQTLPRALPTAIDLEDGLVSDEIGTSIPADDIVNKVTSMGFRRDLVKACVRKLTVNGSTVDLNVVLDTMMKNNLK